MSSELKAILTRVLASVLLCPLFYMAFQSVYTLMPGAAMMLVCMISTVAGMMFLLQDKK